MISEHSAHSTPLPFGIRTWLWRYTCLLLLISMLWHRQAIFESKGDKLSSSAECRIRTHQGLRHQIASRLNARWPTELSRIKLKTWTRQPVPMISEHSAHSTPLPFGIRTWLWRYICLLLLISMLWHRQAVIESKGDKLFSSAECIHTYIHTYINTYINTYIHTYMQTYKNTNMHACMNPSIHTYIHTYMFVVVNSDILAQASDIRIERRQVVFLCWRQDSNPRSHLPTYLPTYLHTYIDTYIHTYIFVVVNFDALAQASDFWIERRQVVFLCWMQDSNPEGLWNPIFSRLNAQVQASYFPIERRQIVFLYLLNARFEAGKSETKSPVDWIPTHKLSYRGSSKDLNSITRPYDDRAFSPLDFTAGWLSHLAPAIYMFLVNFDALAQASKSKGGCVVRACVCVSYNFSWRGDITKLTLWHGYQSLVDGFFWNIKYDTWYGVSIANTIVSIVGDCFAFWVWHTTQAAPVYR